MFRKRGRAFRNPPSPGYEEFLETIRSNPEVAQSYETLFSNLRLLDSSRPLRSVLLTSSQPQEGKTTVAVNLALVMTLVGKKVLLLDADLRKPRIHEIFRLENPAGLADVLAETLTVADVVQRVKIADGREENQGTLSVVASGGISSSSAQAIGSPKFKEVLEHCRNVYDAILVDSPPALSVSDPVLLAPMVDGVVLVLNTGVVTEKDAGQAKERLEQAGGRILGVVLNRFDEKQHGPGFHPYHQYYDHQRNA